MNKIECNQLLINCNKNDDEYSKNNNLDCENIKPIRIVRQYVNSAVYVESSIYDMAPFKRSPLLLNYYSDDDTSHRAVKIKRCVCLTNSDKCPCHPFHEDRSLNGKNSKTSISSSIQNCISASPSLNSLKSYDTTSTVKPQSDEFKLSIPSIVTTCRSSHLDNSQKEEAFRNWCRKKDKQRKKMEEERLKAEELKQKEREKLLEVERYNFRKWLAKKKEEEEKRKKEQEEELEKEKLKAIRKEQKKMENDLKYRLWLKQKEEIYLEKKLEAQLNSIKLADEKQKRVEQSVQAYNEWLKSSKYKPKPVPSNQGLDSLRTSVSVTYINPTPWVPNIENNKQKSSSR